MLFFLTFLFIALDFITGIVKAIATKTFNSTTMRQGLFHKVGSLLCIVLGVLAQATTNYIDIGVNVQVSYAICTYIIIMEIGSTIENVGAINPELVPKKVREIFIKIDNKGE